ncbi:hypothetical protein SMICM304S_03068 [Streptomyces microflavus]
MRSSGPNKGAEVSIVRWNPDGPSWMENKQFASGVALEMGLKRPKSQNKDGNAHTPSLSLEKINEIDGDWLFLSTLTSDGAKALKDVQDKPAYKELGAVKNKQVVTVDGSVWSTRGGPLAADVVMEDYVKALSAKFAPGTPFGPARVSGPGRAAGPVGQALGRALAACLAAAKSAAVHAMPTAPSSRACSAAGETAAATNPAGGRRLPLMSARVMDAPCETLPMSVQAKGGRSTDSARPSSRALAVHSRAAPHRPGSPGSRARAVPGPSQPVASAPARKQSSTRCRSSRRSSAASARISYVAVARSGITWARCRPPW